MISKTALEIINRIYDGKLKVTETHVIKEDEHGPMSIDLSILLELMILHNLKFEEVIGSFPSQNAPAEVVTPPS